MIVGFRDGWLRAFFVDDTHSRNIPPDLEARLFRKLQMIDDATTDQDLRVPPAIISRSCAAIWRGFIRSVSISNGG
jgi:plasmid maintenance system killer protein